MTRLDGLDALTQAVHQDNERITKVSNTTITTKTYERKRLCVEAVQVTAENFEHIAHRFSGTVKSSDGSNVVTIDPHTQYIQIKTHNPRGVNQTKAYVGNWVLETEKGIKIYTETAFQNTFVPVEADATAEEGDPFPKSNLLSQEDIVTLAKEAGLHVEVLVPESEQPTTADDSTPERRANLDYDISDNNPYDKSRANEAGETLVDNPINPVEND